MKRVFSADFWKKNIQMSSSKKTLPVGAEMFRADRQYEAHSRFSQICESP